MSTETTSELNQPNDENDEGEAGGRHRRFGFLHADTGVDADRDATDREATDREAGVQDAAYGDGDVDTGTVYDSADDRDRIPDEAEPHASFTPSTSGPTTAAYPAGDKLLVQGQVVSDEDGQPASTRLDNPAIDDGPVGGTTSGTTGGTTAPAAAFDPSAPLIGDAVTLRASWQHAAAEFVDDPRAAVSEAADLVEHTAQTLVGALQQRQRQLRDQWENETTADGTATGSTGDTEGLRHLMQSYRALFNQLVQS
jgi:hypothetical protein